MWYLEITDLKQWAYCPRVIYYRYCLPLLCPETVKMEVSHEAHEQERKKEQRRSLLPYGLQDGQRHFDVRLISEEWKLSGLVDLVVEREDEVIPVDYKNSTREPGAHFRLQLAAYGLLCEEKWDKPARRGFLYMIPLRKSEEVALGSGLRRRTQQAIDAIRRIVDTEAMPARSSGRARCVNCEFRRFCNDAL
jgi:CRISPR-associated exonuclease Cas4